MVEGAALFHPTGVSKARRATWWKAFGCSTKIDIGNSLHNVVECAWLLDTRIDIEN
jgi:hypothetical protein